MSFMDKREYKQLISMSANGDAKAFSKLYGMVYRDMYYTAFYSLKNDDDAISAVTGAARDGFNSASKLRSEAQFRVFMMRTLCARIKMFFKEYKDDALDDNQPEIKRLLFRLPDVERLLLVMTVCGRFTLEETAAFSGMTTGGVKKRILRAKQALKIKD